MIKDTFNEHPIMWVTVFIQIKSDKYVKNIMLLVCCAILIKTKNKGISSILVF